MRLERSRKAIDTSGKSAALLHHRAIDDDNHARPMGLSARPDAKNPFDSRDCASAPTPCPTGSAFAETARLEARVTEELTT
jgi:hypothetical protein